MGPNPAGRSRVAALVVIAIIAIISVWMSTGADAFFFEKKYLVKNVQGSDVLCDTYVVQKDDWVLRIFRQRGEIADKDFPRFLEIFKILNTDVQNINTIYPGQEVLIPLRVLPPGSIEGQESGVITLPVITITNLPETMAEHSYPYTVQYGDRVSLLIAQRFGEAGSASYRRGMVLFKKMNPDINDINFIRVGQEIRLPDPEMDESGEYPVIIVEAQEDAADLPAVTEKKEVIVRQLEQLPETPEATETPELLGPPTEDPKKPTPPVSLAFGGMVSGFSDQSIFIKASAILNAELTNHGEYYFPRPGLSDFRLDLSKTPLMTFKDGTSVLVTRRTWLANEDQQVIERFRPDIKIIFFEADNALPAVVSAIVSTITAGGYERHLNLTRDNIFTTVRGQYIYKSPGSAETVCLTIIERPGMRVPESIRHYLGDRGVTVRDWVEGENVSGWAMHADTGNYRKPEVTRISALPSENVVSGLVHGLGHRYQSGVDVSFPYAGFQVSASTDMLSLGSARDVLVDYGTLGGEAITAIEKTGFSVVRLNRSADPGQMIAQLTEILAVDVQADPIFWISDRPKLYSPSIQIPGYLLSPRQEAAASGVNAPSLLVSIIPLPPQVASHLIDSGVRIVEVYGVEPD